VVVMSPRPGRISEVVEIDIERPRSLKTMGMPRFGELCDRIRTIFGATAPMVSSL
jgi:NitT/TauT family transport system ATP-binding protein